MRSSRNLKSTKRSKREHLSDMQISLLLGAASVLFVILQFPGLLQGQVISASDLALDHPPYSSVVPQATRSYNSLSDFMDSANPTNFFISSNLKKGNIPLYSTQSELGLPILWTGDGNFGSPLFILSIYFFGPIYGPTLNMLFLIFIGSSSFFYLLKYFKFRNFSALVGAIVFTFNSYTASTIQGGLAISAYMALSLFFVSVHSFMIKPKFANYIGILGSYFLILNNDYPPSLLFIAPVIFVFISWSFLDVLKKSLSPYLVFSRLFLAGLSCIIASAPILLQNYHYLLQMIDRSWRSGYGQHTVNPRTFLDILDPFVFGELKYFPDGSHFQFVRDSFYIGAPALFLVLIGILYQNRSKFTFTKLLMWYSGVLLLLITIPWLNHNIYVHIPFLGQTFASNQLIILIFCTAFLVAQGAEAIQTVNLSSTRVFRGIVLFSFLAYGSVVVLEIKQGIFHGYFLAITVATILLGLALSVQVGVEKGLITRVTQYGIIALVLFSLFPLNGFINWSTKISKVYPQTTTTKYLQENMKQFRVLPLGNALLADTDYAYEISTLAGRGHFTSGMEDLYSKIDPTAFSGSKTQHLFNLKNVDLHNAILDLIGVKYVAIPTVGFKVADNQITTANIRGLKEVLNTEGVLLVERPTVYPYGLNAGNCTYTGLPDWKLLTNVVVSQTRRTSPPLATDYCKNLGDSPMTIISLKGDPNFNKPYYVRFDATHDGVYVLPTAYDADLKLKIDGKQVESVKVNGSLEGVFVRSGIHNLQIIYQPWYFNPSNLLMFLIVFTVDLLLLCLIERQRRIKKRLRKKSGE